MVLKLIPQLKFNVNLQKSIWGGGNRYLNVILSSVKLKGNQHNTVLCNLKSSNHKKSLPSKTTTFYTLKTTILTGVQE